MTTPQARQLRRLQNRHAAALAARDAVLARLVLARLAEIGAAIAALGPEAAL